MKRNENIHLQTKDNHHALEGSSSLINVETFEGLCNQQWVELDSADELSS